MPSFGPHSCRFGTKTPPSMNLSKTTIGIAVLTIVYMVGLTGFLLPQWQAYFEGLTPINLLFAAGMVFAFHKGWSKPFIAYLAAVFAAGWLVELLGVKTGLIFGEYHYDDGLGFKILDIPLIIGLNWVLLIYFIFLNTLSVSFIFP